MVSSSGTIATKRYFYAPGMFEVCKKDLECLLRMTVNKIENTRTANSYSNKKYKEMGHAFIFHLTPFGHLQHGEQCRHDRLLTSVS